MTDSSADNKPGQTGGALPDLDIVARVMAGDEAMYELIMRRYNRLLYRLARSIVHDDEEARDVVQEAYIRAYYHLHQFRGPRGFPSWLARITINEARSRVRGISPVMDTDDAVVKLPAIETTQPERTAIGAETLQLIQKAIDKLPADFRTVFMLRGVEQLSIAETASILDVKQATVKTRFHRARTMLQASLHRRLDEAAQSAFEFGGNQCDGIVAEVLDRLCGR